MSVADDEIMILLMELDDRLYRAVKAMDDLLAVKQSKSGTTLLLGIDQALWEKARLSGKAEGMHIARSYVVELIRDHRSAHPTPSPFEGTLP